jgi:hypothetical protein
MSRTTRRWREGVKTSPGVQEIAYRGHLSLRNNRLVCRRASCPCWSVCGLQATARRDGIVAFGASPGVERPVGLSLEPRGLLG